MIYFGQKKKGMKPFSVYFLYLKMLPRSNSKLCFELLEILSAAQNNLPLRRGLKNLRSRFLVVVLVFILHFLN